METHLQNHLAQRPGEVGWSALNLRTGKKSVYNSRRFLAASTIKLPVLAVYAEARQREKSLVYHYRPDDYVEDSPYFENLPPGTAVQGDTLAEWMMIRSDNTATNVLIQNLGIELIQKHIEAWGLHDSYLQRLMMDLAARAEGRENWTTPEDMCHFMALLARRQLVAPEACHWMLDVLYRSEDLEKIPHLFRPPIRVANKPGELPGTRSDVGYVHNTDHEVVMALFCDGLPNAEAEVQSDDWLAELAQLLWQDLTQS